MFSLPSSMKAKSIWNLKFKGFLLPSLPALPSRKELLGFFLHFFFKRCVFFFLALNDLSPG